MQTEINHNERCVGIWLNHDDPETPSGMMELIQDYHARKYHVAVYRSGEQDLASMTAALLKKNI